MKKCNNCGLLKPVSQFNKRTASADGLQYQCSLCTTTRLKYFHSQQMETIDGHIAIILARIKSRSKKENIDFDLDINYLKSIMQDKCPILGVQLTWCKRSGKPTKNSPSLDRLNPKKGYVSGNVSWISYRANRIKQDASLIELKKLVNWVEKQSG